mmetsp:Transcript_66941/g.174159  ORF Transcript_66941/g.174159 Transcript_66941/m.174159 type:complete len:200 (-) Transcript_66941:204-803(-)
MSQILWSSRPVRQLVYRKTGTHMLIRIDSHDNGISPSTETPKHMSKKANELNNASAKTVRRANLDLPVTHTSTEYTLKLKSVMEYEMPRCMSQLVAVGGTTAMQDTSVRFLKGLLSSSSQTGSYLRVKNDAMWISAAKQSMPLSHCWLGNPTPNSWSVSRTQFCQRYDSVTNRTILTRSFAWPRSCLAIATSPTSLSKK